EEGDLPKLETSILDGHEVAVTHVDRAELPVELVAETDRELVTGQVHVSKPEGLTGNPYRGVHPSLDDSSSVLWGDHSSHFGEVGGSHLEREGHEGIRGDVVDSDLSVPEAEIQKDTVLVQNRVGPSVERMLQQV